MGLFDMVSLADCQTGERTTSENPQINSGMPNQHFKIASGLWVQRDRIVQSARLTFAGLIELDQQIDEQLRDLNNGEGINWGCPDEFLKADDPGSVFMAAFMAFEDGDPAKIGKVVEVATSSQAAFRGATSALGWLSGRRFRDIIIDLVSSKSWQHRSLGIAACGARRVNPRAYLNKAVDSANLFLKIRALKTAGQLKRDDLQPVLLEHLKDTDHACRFEAARSALLLGERAALASLGDFILSKSKYLGPAMEVALRVVDSQTGLEWLKTLSRDPNYRHEMLAGIAIVGSPAYVPILIRQMQEPDLARAAADAFTVITGMDLAENDLAGEAPEGYPSENAAQDEQLAWPAADRILNWWEENHDTFQRRSRYLSGQPVSPEHCKNLLKNGDQRLRHAASLELALGHVETPFFNTRARAGWQQKRLITK
jgi:uncharacterized protein (TIGR02270 family)